MLEVSSENLLRSISHTLTYADVFDYPLTAGEVYRYLILAGASFKEVNAGLENKILFTRMGEFITLRGREKLVETRERRTKVAARLWPKAVRYGQIIASLPFVRMVAVTGSLAMNNTEEGNDVDYMVVTAPNRLWTCRAMALLVARFAKLDNITICPNYLITTNALALEERTLYVAHELTQMIPLSGMEVYNELRRLNDWTRDYLPNARGAPEFPRSMKQITGFPFFQSVLEFLFRLPFFRWLEKREMDRKIARLRREQASSSESYFSADVCKGHIDRHGENLVTALAVRLQEIP
jgi:hypothetical protein